MPVLSYLVGGSSLHEVDDVFLTERLLQRHDGMQHDEQCLASFESFLWMQTVVTIVAVVGGIVFAEVMQQQLAAAQRRLGVGGGLFQQLSPDVLFGGGLAVHELLEFPQVVLAEEGDAVSLSPVASGASRLLIVALKTLRNVVVHDKTHIGFVDSHAEGDGCDNHIYALHKEVVLRLRARCRVESCVVRRRLDVVCLEHGSEFLHLFARDAIDDTALALVLLDVFYYLFVDVLALLPHFIIEVGAVEGTLELLGIDDAEALLDVRTHLVGGSCREGYHRGVAYAVDGGAYVAVVGTEVVTPFRYAMSLIDSIERDFERLEEAEVILFVERLRSHIKQLGAPAVHIVIHLLQRGFIERRVQVVCQSACFTYSVDYIHLVFHERNQRRHHDGGAVHKQ